MHKIKIDIIGKPTEVFVVKKTPKGYLVTTKAFEENEEPTKVFHVTDNQVILR